MPDATVLSNVALSESNARIFEALATQQCVKSLDLCDFRNGEPSNIWRSVCDLPRNNPHLEELVLSYPMAHDRVLDDNVVQLLAQALVASKSLRVLELGDYSVTEKGCMALAEAFSQNPPIEEFTIKRLFAGVRSETVKHFFGSLSTNSNLGKLNIEGGLSWDFCKYLVNPLQNGSGVKALSLNRTRVESTKRFGFMALSAALETTGTLKRLCVEGFHASTETELLLDDCQMFGSALSKNVGLEHLSMCRLPEAGQLSLLDGLASNSVLKELHLPSLSLKGCQILADILRKNTVLKVLGVTVSREESEKPVLFILDGLCANCGVEYFSASDWGSHGVDYSDDIEYGESLIAMLEQNNSLVFVSPLCEVNPYLQTSTFYLRRNSLRRDGIGRHSSTGEGRESAIAALSMCLSDLDVLFFIVQNSAQLLFCSSS